MNIKIAGFIGSGNLLCATIDAREMNIKIAGFIGSGNLLCATIDVLPLLHNYPTIHSVNPVLT